MIRKLKGPDHIADHIEKRGYRHNYVLYYTGADYYDLPYWTFVHLAKDAGATVELHRLAVADTLVIDRYFDENCLVLPEETGRKESVREMKKRNKDIEKIKHLVENGSKSGYVMMKEHCSTRSAFIRSRDWQRMLRHVTGLAA